MEKQNFNERQFDAFSVKIIKRLIKRDFAGIKDIFEDADSELIARFIDSISEDDDYLKDDETDKEMQAGDNEYDDIIELFRCVPEEKSVEVFARLESEKREKIILHSITNQELDHLIEGLINEDLSVLTRKILQTYIKSITVFEKEKKLQIKIEKTYISPEKII